MTGVMLTGFITRCFSTTLCNHRRPNLKHPRPKLMARRIMEAITEPVYPHQLNDPGKLCSVIEEEKGKSKDEEEALVQVRIFSSLFIVLSSVYKKVFKRFKRGMKIDKTIFEPRSITCHMGSHSITCHQTQMNAPIFSQSQTGQYLIIYMSQWLSD